MSGKTMPPVPPNLKHLQHYLKTAAEHDERDIVIAYWCRLYALQLGLKSDRTSQEAKRLFGYLMDWLEKTKSEHLENEAIVSDIPAQAHLENYALKLFIWADSQDRTGNHNRNVVKAFYTAGLIYDVLDTFGEVSGETQQTRKYAKWKATYIHNCLKNGEVPIPGPPKDEIDDEGLGEPSTSNMPSANLRAFSTVSGIGHINTMGGLGGESSTLVDVSSITDTTKQEIEEADQEKSGQGKSDQEKRGQSSDEQNSATTSTGVPLTPEQISKAQKYCKFAASALNYDDVPTAVLNLQKALQLLNTGVDDD